MIRIAAIMLALAIEPIRAFGQTGCLPPEEPFAYEPPRDDRELRELINGQYQDYIRGAESYLNCLNEESIRVRAEFQRVLDRYIQFFGDEAGVRYDETR